MIDGIASEMPSRFSRRLIKRETTLMAQISSSFSFDTSKDFYPSCKVRSKAVMA